MSEYLEPSNAFIKRGKTVVVAQEAAAIRSVNVATRGSWYMLGAQAEMS